MDKKVILKKLLEFLIGDKNIEIPTSLEDMRKLWRDLVLECQLLNVNENILKDEDKYLRLELLNRRLTDGEKLKSVKETLSINNPYADKIVLWKGDITSIYTDVIVNNTTINMLNNELLNSNLSNEIYLRSGMRLRIKCRDLMKNESMNVSDILVTRAYNLPCDFIIHVISPELSEEITDEQERNLRMAYFNVLECAKNNMIKNVVLPLIGNYNNCDKKNGVVIAVNSVCEYIENNKNIFDSIVFQVDSDELYDIYKKELSVNNA